MEAEHRRERDGRGGFAQDCDAPRVVQWKRYGTPLDPQNAPRKKTAKPPKEKPNLSLSVEARLRDCAKPVLGLQFVAEWRSGSMLG